MKRGRSFFKQSRGIWNAFAPISTEPFHPYLPQAHNPHKGKPLRVNLLAERGDEGSLIN